MNWSRLLLRSAPLAWAVTAASAEACTNGAAVRAYFSYQRPSISGDMVRLRVRPLRREGDGFSFVRARLLEGPFELTRDGFVRIEFPEAPMGTNCIVMGPDVGPVFVVGRLRRTAPGLLTLVATPTNTPRFAPPGCYDDDELDQYIVDPDYLCTPPTPMPPPREEDRR